MAGMGNDRWQFDRLIKFFLYETLLFIVPRKKGWDKNMMPCKDEVGHAHDPVKCRAEANYLQASFGWQPGVPSNQLSKEYHNNQDSPVLLYAFLARCQNGSRH